MINYTLDLCLEREPNKNESQESGAKRKSFSKLLGLRKSQGILKAVSNIEDWHNIVIVDIITVA